MENFVKMLCKWQVLVFLAVGFSLLSCESDSDSGIPKYDPGKPIVLDTFYPTSGPIATQVILLGANFGDNADDVTVMFNEKKATVISAKGDKMLVLAPRLPGDECTISVSISGSETVKYEDLKFDYIIQTTVSTLAGGDTGATGIPKGIVRLSTSQFEGEMNKAMVVDADDNLFFSVVTSDGTFGYSNYYLANEESDRLKFLNDPGFMVGGHFCGYNSASGDVYYRPTNGSSRDFSYFDSTNEYAAVSAGNVNWDSNPNKGNDMAEWGVFQTMALRPSDGMFYMRGHNGEFARFDPMTAEGTNLSPENRFPFEGGATYGLVFDPTDDNIMYFSVTDKHCIYKYDFRTETSTVFAGQEGLPGYMDGQALTARFNKPHQICIDSEMNMYIADTDNHCVRKIALETMYVSTAAGSGGEAGYVNGSVRAARFNKPVGLAITSEDIVYICDSENKAIRRLAEE